MPGGSKYRQWYAMRKAMQERGTWRPKHTVPAQEEGEPVPKAPRWYERTVAGTDLAQEYDTEYTGEGTSRAAPAPAEQSSDDEPPPLESSPTPEGR